MRRAIALLARVLGALAFRRVEVTGRERLPEGRPVLLVANHFNGFVDPLVIGMALGRLPRFVAKAALRTVPGLGLLLRAAGVVFVERRVDGPSTGANAQAFADCHRALARRDVVAIFPEGTTHDRPMLDPLRTGAARIALGARAAGAERPVIVPVGLTYPDKVALRSAVLVQIGRPIELDDVVAPTATDEDRDAARALTDEIDRRLRRVSPDFPDVETWLAYDLAADVAERRPDATPGRLSDRARLARSLVAATPEAQADVRQEVGRYATLLAQLRLTDHEVVDGASLRRLVGDAARTGIAVALLGSLVVATAPVNAIPFGLVLLASLRTRTPITKGTVRAVVGLLAFPAAWITGAVLATQGAGRVLLAVLVFAAGAVAVVALLDRAMVLARRLTTWHQVKERAAAVDFARGVRADAVTAIRAAAASVERR